MKEFKVGDVVILREQGSYGPNWDGPMTVLEYRYKKVVILIHPRNAEGGFGPSEIRHLTKLEKALC